MSQTTFKAWLRRGLTSFAIGLSTVLACTTTAHAAEEVVLQYGIFGRTLSVAELETFAETGEQSSLIEFLLDLSNQDPAIAQQMLTTEIPVEFMFLHNFFNGLPGEFILHQIGQTVHIKGDGANIQALRGAILTSAIDDRLSLLEVIQNYPTPQMYVDGEELLDFLQDAGPVISRVSNELDSIVAIAQDLLGGLVCECENPPAR